MTTTRRSAFLFAALLAARSLAQAPAAGVDPVAGPGEAPIAALLDRLGPDVALYDEHVVTLANPFFEGRGATTIGNERAADYVAWYMERIGLTPAFPTVETTNGKEVVTPNGSFSQRFAPGEVRGRQGPRPVKVLGSGAQMRVGDGAWATLIPDLDYSVLGCSGTGSVEGGLVFVGYSISAGPNGYLGYPPGTDLSGKVAVVLRYEPLKEDGTSRWSDGEGWSLYATLEAKVSAALRRNAAAVIVVTPPGVAGEDAGKLAAASETADGEFEVPVIMMSQERADFLLSKADPGRRSLLELRRLVDEAPAIVEMPGASVKIETKVDHTPDMTRNVGGLLKGRGALAGEIVVIGAHFDHAGHGQYGGRVQGQIHPGADDNASGTAAMLLAAARLHERYAALPEDAEARSILFLGFSAEEWGLLGSRYYCEHPIAPIGDHVFMFNMDMVGRVRDNTLEMGGEQTAEGLGEWLRPYLDSAGFQIKPLGPGVFGRSDHASFFQAGVPCLFFFSGFHDQYHTPEDVSMLVNRVGGVRVSTMVQEMAMAMATRPDRPVFVNNDGSGRQVDRPPSVRPPERQNKVRFGAQPSYDYTGGVRIEQVFPGTTAEEVGLRPGDIMTAWNGTKLEGVEQWSALLNDAKPGDEVTVTFTREGKEMTGSGKLKAAG